MDSRRKVYVAFAVVLVLAVAAFAVAGCGSATSTTTAAPATTTTTAAASTTTAPASSGTTAMAPTTTAGSTGTSAAAANGASGTLVVKGLVDTPATWTVADLQKMNPVTATVTHPKKGDTQYTGVKLTDLFKTLGVQSGATTLVTSSSDGYSAELALSDIAASAGAMLAIGDDGTLNMVMPGMSSKAWASDVTSWEFK